MATVETITPQTAPQRQKVEVAAKPQNVLYELLGGEKAVDAAVDRFYEKVLKDDRIKHFFDGLDMTRQRKMQKSFLTHAFGGPSNYNGRTMRIAHRRLVQKMGLNDSHFDAVLDDLRATLLEMGVQEELVTKAITIANSVRDDVLDRDPADVAVSKDKKKNSAPSKDIVSTLSNNKSTSIMPMGGKFPIYMFLFMVLMVSIWLFLLNL
jgi:hemoglobin